MKKSGIIISASIVAVALSACGAEAPTEENTASTAQAYSVYPPWQNVRRRDNGQCLSVDPGAAVPTAWTTCDASDPRQALQQAWPQVHTWNAACLNGYPANFDDLDYVEFSTCQAGLSSEAWTYDSNHELHNAWDGRCPGAGCGGYHCGTSTAELSGCAANNLSQQWDFETLPNPPFGIHFMALRDRCLDDGALTAAAATGVQLKMHDCINNDVNQWFSYTASHQIRDEHNGLCVDIQAFSNADGAVVQEWPCNGMANQSWTIASDGQIISDWNGKCVEVKSYDTSNNAVVQMYSCYGGFNQVWQH